MCSVVACCSSSMPTGILASSDSVIGRFCWCPLLCSTCCSCNWDAVSNAFVVDDRFGEAFWQVAAKVSEHDSAQRCEQSELGRVEWKAEREVEWGFARFCSSQRWNKWEWEKQQGIHAAGSGQAGRDLEVVYYHYCYMLLLLQLIILLILLLWLLLLLLLFLSILWYSLATCCWA